MAIYKKVSNYTGTEPISLSVAKDFLKVSDSADDTYITELIEVAREIIEKETNTVLVEHEVTEYRRQFPTVAPYEIQLQFSGVIPDGETVTFRYKTASDTTSTLTQGTDFLVSQYNGVLSLTPMGTDSWPTDLYIETDSIVIAYKVEPQGQTPLPLKQAMRLLICHFYDDRSAVAFTKDAVELPLGYQRLISTYKNYFF